MALSITDILGGSLADAVKGIISDFKADPTVKLQLQAAVEQNATQLQEKEIELQGKLVDSYQSELAASSGNIQAEAKSNDKYTERARPTFMYLVEAILGFNFILLPLVQALFSKPISPISIPSDVLTLFGVCVTGYVGFRSFDKFMSLPGESSAKLPMGIQIGNKQ